MEQTYFLYITDRRFSLPILNIVNNSDFEGAKLAATKHLTSCPYNESVEVMDSSRRSTVITRDTLRLPLAS